MKTDSESNRSWLTQLLSNQQRQASLMSQPAPLTSHHSPPIMRTGSLAGQDQLRRGSPQQGPPSIVGSTGTLTSLWLLNVPGLLLGTALCGQEHLKLRSGHFPCQRSPSIPSAACSPTHWTATHTHVHRNRTYWQAQDQGPPSHRTDQVTSRSGPAAV